VLKKILEIKDIPEEIVTTPVGELLQYHNLKIPFKNYKSAELLIAMCMDNRKQICIPENFAYIIRTGGGNLRHAEFKVSYVIAIGGVTHIALIAHNNCGMVNLVSKKEDFIAGLVKNAGWSKEKAEEHFINFAPMFEIENEIDFVVTEAKRLNAKYPKILVVPLFYNLDDNLLYYIKE